MEEPNHELLINEETDMNVEKLRKISPNEVTQQNLTAYNLHCFIFHINLDVCVLI